VSAARSQIGKPYVYGAAGPDSYDCSGLTMWAWAHGGVSLSHSSSAQYSETTHVSGSQMQPGDLLFYYSDIHHVAMYSGGGMMIEAPHTGSNVREVPVRDGYIGVGRPG
jgi:cell wall-associated NlpC family hydrolase